VLARIQAAEQTKIIPVVVLAGSTEKEDFLRSCHNGANAYLRKPIILSDFTRAVQTLATFWLLLNEPPPGL
jgi:CheY-like chemotaxis protein